MCHPSFIQVTAWCNGRKAMKYLEMIGIDSEGTEVNLQLPLDMEAAEIVIALRWYFDNGYTLRGNNAMVSA